MFTLKMFHFGLLLSVPAVPAGPDKFLTSIKPTELTKLAYFI